MLFKPLWQVAITYLAASFALVGFFSGMDALVNGKRGPLNELLVASREVADVRPDTTVDSF
jgi:hypothetical protein